MGLLNHETPGRVFFLSARAAIELKGTFAAISTGWKDCKNCFGNFAVTSSAGTLIIPETAFIMSSILPFGTSAGVIFTANESLFIASCFV